MPAPAVLQPTVAASPPVPAGPPSARPVDVAGWLAWLLAATVTVTLHPDTAQALTATALAPWVEEVVFRRGLHDGLSARFGPDRAVWPTALAFAAAHAAVAALGAPGRGPTGPDPVALSLAAATLLPALAIGRAYRATGSLGACVGLHAAFNAVWHLGLASALALDAMPGSPA